MKKYLVVLLTLLMSKPVYADSWSFLNCRTATEVITILAAGGASEEFLKSHFYEHFALWSKDVYRAYSKTVSSAYFAIGSYANTVSEFKPEMVTNDRLRPMYEIESAAIRLSCSDKSIDRPWK